LIPALIGFIWGLSPAINWSSLSYFHSISTFIPIFHTSITNSTSIGIRARSTNNDQIGKLELAFQKLAEETKKQFDDLKKSLENIASSLKKGFSGSLQRSIKEIVDKKSSTEESSLQNTVQISSPKSTPLIQPVTQSTDNPQPVQPLKTHNQPAVNTTTHACNIDTETTPKNPYKIVLLRTKNIPIRVFSFKKLEIDGKPPSERPPRKRMRSLQIQLHNHRTAKHRS
jgi:hypothetical protein